jgi:hypothetical protein
MVEVQGVVVGTDPYRRWGPTFGWTVVIFEAILSMGQSSLSAFDKRDVVVANLSHTQEFYREGPFTAWAANNRKSAIVRTIKSEGLDQYLPRMQIEHSTIGPVFVPSGRVSVLQRARISLSLWQNSLVGGSKRIRNHEYGDQEG